MKKLYTLLLILFFVSTINSSTVNAETISPPKVSADGAILMDATTGKILYEKNIDKPYPPASTTKIMTALLTLEKCKLDEVVTVGKKPPLADGSKIYIFEGEKIKVKDLLHALLLASANDCADALAEHISGSTEAFAKLMNERAKELGCKNTNFVNPNGLYDPKHNTSARDLALIMRELVKHSEYVQISKTISYTIAPTNKSKQSRPLWNGNKLIQKGSSYYYSFCEGAKTGYTTQSQHSYVASSNKNNQKLVLALIHDTEKTFFPDSINLFNYGFDNFQLVKLYSKGDVVTKYTQNNLNINLLASTDFYYVKNKKDTDPTTVNLENKDLSSMSFKKNDMILNSSIMLKNKSVGNLQLLSDSDHIIDSKIHMLTSNNMNKVLITVISITLFIIVIVFIIIRRKKMRANN